MFPVTGFPTMRLILAIGYNFLAVPLLWSSWNEVTLATEVTKLIMHIHAGLDKFCNHPRGFW